MTVRSLPIRILVFTPEYLPANGGGIVTFYRHLLPALVAEGHSVHVVEGSGVHSAPGAQRRVMDGVTVETLEYPRYLRHLERFQHLKSVPGLQHHIAAAWAMWEQAEEGNAADVIEACDWGLSFLPPVLTGRTPAVIQAHGSIGQIDQHDPVAGEEAQGSLIRLLEVSAMQRAGALITYCAANAEFWRSQTGRDVRSISPAWLPFPAGQGEQLAGCNGLVLGRVQRWKGPQVLAEALRLMGAKAPQINWLGRDTVWGARNRSAAAQLAETYPDVWGSCIIHGAPVTPERASALQRTALFNLVPSTWDVFNFTCVEAMASGRPVVCSTGAGASGLVDDGVNGFLFEAGNAAALAGAIDRVLRLEPSRQSEVGRNAQATIRERLAPHRIAAERLAAYQSVIDTFKPRPAPSGDWLLDAVSGRAADERDGLAFLDHQPLKSILKYSVRRLGDKLRGEFHAGK